MFLFQVLQDVTREFRRSLTSCGATYFQGKHAILWISSCQYKAWQYGSDNDSGILKLSHMAKCFEDNSFNVPEGSKIPGMYVELPYFLVGDEIFPLKRPYPGTLN